MHKRIEMLKQILAADDINLYTYRYKGGECSCCFGPDVTEGESYVVIPLTIASNEGRWDSVGKSKTYFTRTGELKHKMSVRFGVLQLDPKTDTPTDPESLDVGAKLFRAAKAVGFNTEWDGVSYSCVELLPDVTHHRV